MRKVTAVLQKAQKAIHDFDLLKILQSEINHELSTKTFQVFRRFNRGALKLAKHHSTVVDGREVVGLVDLVESSESRSFGDFVVDWDSPQSQDVVLRRRCESGEEVAVSALLSVVNSNENTKFPREAFVKVGVKKPGLRSMLQFDCVATAQVGDGCDFEIRNLNYIPSSDLDSSACKGPSTSFFRSSDQGLQDELHKYLEARGINKSFAESLLHHLHRKEQGLYVEWLHKLQAIVRPSESRDERPMQEI